MATDPTPETPPAEDAEASEAKGGGKKKIIVLATVLLAVVGGAGVAYSQFGLVDRAAQSVFGGEGEAEEEEDEPLEFGEFSQLEPLVVNPSGTEGSRYLMVSVGLEAAEAAVLEEVTAKEVVIRDLINDALSAKTVETLSNIANRDSLKEEIRTILNGILEEGEIDRLYFTQFMLQ